MYVISNAHSIDDDRSMMMVLDFRVLSPDVVDCQHLRIFFHRHHPLVEHIFATKNIYHSIKNQSWILPLRQVIVSLMMSPMMMMTVEHIVEELEARVRRVP